MSILTLIKNNSVLESIHEHFKLKYSTKECPTCGAEFINEEKKFKIFPKVLILGFESKHLWKSSIEEELNLKNYLSDTVEEKDKNPNYTLQAMILRSSGPLKFKSAIRTLNGDWVKLKGDELFHGFDFEKAQVNPHLLFYT
jgi:hypothetical protein